MPIEEPAPIELPAEEAPAVDATKAPITVNAWARVGMVLQGISDPEKLDHLTESGDLELHTDGQITDEIGLTGNIVGSFSPSDGNGTVELLDVIGRFDITDPFHVWVGRMLVPSDRANFSGAWFASPWFYPGLLGSGPHQGPHGRNDGMTVWGQAEGGLFKYYVSAFDLHDTAKKPLWSGRLNLSLLNPEPGYYHSSTYYGAKDILAIGVAGQLQNDGSVDPAGMAPVDDYAEFNADVLFEKNLSGSGTLTLEGAFYKYVGDNDLKLSWLVLASYLTPEKVGPGKLQPLIRLQQAKPQVGDAQLSFEGQLGYVIADYAARLALGYKYTKQGPAKGNAIFLGAQFQK